MFGQPVDTGAVKNLAQEYDLTVIEDAAHALGTTHISDTVGSIGDYCFFSFRFSKEVTIMNGGVLLTSSDVSDLEEPQRPSRLWPAELGTVVVGEYIRGRLPGKLFQQIQQEILTPFFTSSSASLGETAPVQIPGRMRTFLSEQDTKLADQVRARRQNAALYDDLLPNVDRPDRSTKYSFYRYPILIDEGRDEFATDLQRAGVGCSRMYSYVISPQGLCSTAESFSNRIVNLPVHAGLDEPEVRKIASVVRGQLESDEQSS
jgi:dTDP-4-amino-4,6-dideoxygalactose transaminase